MRKRVTLERSITLSILSIGLITILRLCIEPVNAEWVDVAGKLNGSLIPSTRMCIKRCFLVTALALVSAATAQPADRTDVIGCEAEEAALEREIDLARSKGQMLRRRQLTEALAAVQSRCEALAPERSRAARIDSLERRIRELRLELDRAEDRLRDFRTGDS